MTLRRRRRLGFACIAIGVCALGLVLSASPVQAEAPSKTGWWFELQSKSLPTALPAPPVVPDGGLYVQQGPNGPVAYGAVHYMATDAVSATLTLKTAPGSTTQLPTTAIQACVTSSSWNPPKQSPGAWEDAPKYGAPCTPGKIATDNSAVAFFFNAPFFTTSGLDVAIVPIEGSNPFTLTFDKPAFDSLSVTTKPTTLPKTPVTTVPSAAAAGGAGSAPSGVASAAAKPSTPAAPAAPEAPATADNRSSLANNVLNVAGLGDPDRGERAVALAGASAIVVGWWLLSTRATRMPQLLGALGGGRVEAVGSEPVAPRGHVGGVGRFAKARSTSARRLR